jgi:hypothetical protein
MILSSCYVLALFIGIPGIPHDFRQLAVAVARAACVECLFLPVAFLPLPFMFGGDDETGLLHPRAQSVFEVGVAGGI